MRLISEITESQKSQVVNALVALRKRGEIYRIRCDADVLRIQFRECDLFRVISWAAACVIAHLKFEQPEKPPREWSVMTPAQLRFVTMHRGRQKAARRPEAA